MSFTVALYGASVAAAVDAGRFNFVYGDVRVADENGKVRRVKRGARLHQGDTVRTTRRGTAQIKLVDGAAIAVRPNSELRIDAYIYQREGQEDRSFFSLLAGTFRSITGSIGRRQRSNYRVTTLTATIGIRGSDGDFGYNPGSGLTAVRTYSGGHSLTAPDADGVPVTVDINPGQIVVVQPGQGPTYSSTFPFSTGVPSPRGEDQEGDGQDGEQATVDASGDEDETSSGSSQDQEQQQTAGDNTGTDGDDSLQTGGGFAGQDGSDDGLGDDAATRALGDDAATRALSSDSNQLASNTLIIGGGLPVVTTPILDCQEGNTACSQQNQAGPGTGLVGAFTFDNAGTTDGVAGSVRVTGAGGPSVFLDDDGSAVIITDPGGTGGFGFVADNAPLMLNVPFDIPNSETGEIVSTGRWGLWGGGFQAVAAGQPVTANSGFHFAVADRFTTAGQLAAQAGVSFSYTKVGGTATNETGSFPTPETYEVDVVGSFTGDVSLGSVLVSVGANFPSGSTDWTLSGDGTVADFIGQDGITLSIGGCTPCGELTAPGSSGPPRPPEASGVFLGPNAQGVITSFSATDGSNSITGTAVGVRSPDSTPN